MHVPELDALSTLYRLFYFRKALSTIGILGFSSLLSSFFYSHLISRGQCSTPLFADRNHTLQFRFPLRLIQSIYLTLRPVGTNSYQQSTRAKWIRKTKPSSALRHKVASAPADPSSSSHPSSMVCLPTPEALSRTKGRTTRRIRLELVTSSYPGRGALIHTPGDILTRLSLKRGGTMHQQIVILYPLSVFRCNGSTALTWMINRSTILKKSAYKVKPPSKSLNSISDPVRLSNLNTCLSSHYMLIIR